MIESYLFMTLIVSCNSKGVPDRCDARCHDSESPVCQCICGGRFHGKGSKSRALDAAVSEYGRELISRLEPEGHDVSGLVEALGGPLFARA